MAAHAYVAEMQTINPASVQQIVRSGSHAVQLTGGSGVAAQQAIQLGGAQVGKSGATVATATAAAGTAGGQPTATVIQPTQTHQAGQQFIVTFSGEAGDQQEAVLQPSSGQQVVYQTHTAATAATAAVVGGTQYVEAPADHTIYATSNGQLQTYNDYNQATMYTPVTGTYFQTTSGSPVQTMSGGLSHTTAGGIQGQIVTHQGGTYLVQGNMMDGDGQLFTHTSRASPATDMGTTDRVSHFDVKSLQREVQWLIDNYETAEGVSLPRSTMYYHYLRHCQEEKMDPMNPASFGKLIRSVYLGLRTRRLGTRGNSKYHYYGIRIKATSPLNQYTDEQTMALRQQPANQGKRRFKSMSQLGSGEEGGAAWSQPAEGSSQQHQQFLGDASAAIPTFGQIELGDERLPDGVTLEHLEVFEVLYKEHSEAILDIVVNLQFSLIEALWQSFWRTSPLDIQQCDSDIDQRLCKESLVSVCQLKCVQQFIRESDYSFYQALVEVLIPDVLRPIPSTLTQAIRNFAKSLEGWLRSAMIGLPEEMIRTKVASVSAFAQTLRRYTSLNHLAQAARAVLQNTTQINQMLADLNRVDFANVQEQASWVCQCDDALVHQLEQDFKKTLQQQNSLEQWADWLESVVNQVLRRHDASPEFPKAARQFLLKWSFYSSMVIRDLTLRSAASFGSFHLIRLLYDEYMFYLVEHKVAAATGETSIAVMGEVRQFVDFSDSLSLDEPTADKKPLELSDALEATTSGHQTADGMTAAGQTGSRQLVDFAASGEDVRADKKPVEMSSLLKPVPAVQRVVATAAKPTTLLVSSQPAVGGPVCGVRPAVAPQQLVTLSSQPAAAAAAAAVGHAAALPKIVNIVGATCVAPAAVTASVGGAVTRVAGLAGGIRLAGVRSPATVTVLATSNARPSQTIVVVPVSVGGTGGGGGDTQPLKRLKLN